jgi:hypothetical protein
MISVEQESWIQEKALAIAGNGSFWWEARGAARCR